VSLPQVLQNVNSATDAADASCHANRDLLSCAAMQLQSEAVSAPASIVSETIPIERVEMRLVRLPLNEPFETSFGSIDSRLIFLVSLSSAGMTGWGEVV